MRPDLTVDGPALDAVAVICRRLDGIPLALELAAARLAGLQPLELADRVRDRFAVLTSGDRTAEARQRTLRSAVDWSHDLLTPQERVLFRRLAVFRGGWTLTAAEAVVADTELPAQRVMELLERLVRQSLVVADQSGGHTRYRMLETLRQYATGKLADAGDTTAMDAAHAAYFLAMGEQAETGLRGSTQARWLAVLRTEHANLRAALNWLVATDGQIDQAQRLAGSLGLYWHLGRHLEGREVLRRVIALPGGSPQSRARALQAVSLVERPRACIVHPSAQCAAAARESLNVFQIVGDRGRAAFSELLLAVEGISGGAHPDADAALEHADSEFAALGDDWGRAVAAFVRMEKLTYHADLASVRAAAADATTRFRALDDGWGLSAVLYHFGWALTRFGVPADAVPVLQEAIDVASAAGVYNTAQWATADLGLALLGLGRVDEAATYFTRAGTARDQVGDDAGTILHTYGQAVLAATRGDHPAARTLFVRAHDGFQRLGVAVPTGLALAGIAAADEHLGDTGAALNGYQRLLEHAESSGEMGLMAAALEGLARAALTTANPRVPPSCWPGPQRSAPPTIVRPRRAKRPRTPRQPPRWTGRWPKQPTRQVKPAAGSTAERFGRVTGLHQRGADLLGVDRAADHHQPGRSVHLYRLHAGNIPQPGGHHADGVSARQTRHATSVDLPSLPSPCHRRMHQSLPANAVVPLSPHATPHGVGAAPGQCPDRTARHGGTQHHRIHRSPRSPRQQVRRPMPGHRGEGQGSRRSRHHHRSRCPDADGGTGDAFQR